MHPLHLGLTVIDIAQTLESERLSRRLPTTDVLPAARAGASRRLLARLAADVSRRSADTARWLDDGVAMPR